MGTEIERKFLVNEREVLKLLKDYDEKNTKQLRQGYLNTDPDRTVRIRLETTADSGFGVLCIKGRPDSQLVRAEYEYPISRDDAIDLLLMCESSIIEKTRYYVMVNDKLWELDIYFGDNEGLITAEVELNYYDEEVILPTWVRQEITYDTRYANSNLSYAPFKLFNAFANAPL